MLRDIFLGVFYSCKVQATTLLLLKNILPIFFKICTAIDITSRRNLTDFLTKLPKKQGSYRSIGDVRL